MFARHCRERFHHGGFADRGRAAELLGVAVARGGNRIGAQLAPRRQSADIRCVGIEDPV
jgi:hypothetical protein